MRPAEIQQGVVVLCEVPQLFDDPLPLLLVPVHADVDHDGRGEGDAVEDHAVVVGARQAGHVHAEVTDEIVVAELRESQEVFFYSFGFLSTLLPFYE